MKCLLGLVVASALVAIPTLAHADKAADCLAGGRKLDEKGHHADAITAWKACLATTPDDATLEAEIAAAAFQLHDLDVAEKLARAAIAHTKDPNHKAAALFTLGRVQEERKDTKAAIASYTESLTLRQSAVVRGRLVALDPKAPIPTAASAGVVPPAFKKIVDERKAALKMNVVSWWQDDLDHDGKDENIAALCSGDDGVYLIEHQGSILVATRTNAGREICPEDTKPAPSWQTEHRGFIDHSYSVHRASELSHIAVRGHKAVVIYEGEDGADGQFGLDWDALTTSDNIRYQPALNDVPFVVVMDADARWTSVGKGLALSATVTGDKVVLHVKSAAQVVVSFCSNDEHQPCTKQIAKPVNGVADLTVPDPDAKTSGSRSMLKLEAAGVKSRALLLRADAELVGGYPSAAPATKP